MKRLTLRIPNETYLYFNEVANKNNMSLNEYFTQLLNEKMNQYAMNNSLIDFNHKLNEFAYILNRLIEEQNKLSHASEITVNMLADIFGINE